MDKKEEIFGKIAEERIKNMIEDNTIEVKVRMDKEYFYAIHKMNDKYTLEVFENQAEALEYAEDITAADCEVVVMHDRFFEHLIEMFYLLQQAGKGGL